MNDKRFQLKEQNGNIVNCEIIKVVPNNEEPDKPYILYTDFKPEHETLCGMLIEENGNYTINRIKEDYIVDYLKDELKDFLARQSASVDFSAFLSSLTKTELALFILYEMIQYGLAIPTGGASLLLPG